MSEHDVVQRTNAPATIASLTRDLHRVGLTAGMHVLVHASLSALGWVCGGAAAVLQALCQVLTSEGTIVMPSFTTGLTDPADWEHPPVPEDWKDTIRAEMPAFDPERTPTRQMGRIAETFRTWPNVVRSTHPHYSFSALGRRAEEVIEEHSLECGLGEGSPLARLYECGAHVLVLGVGHDNNTSLHLAEHRADYPGKRFEIDGAPVTIDGTRQWVRVRDLVTDTEDFARIGSAFEHGSDLVHVGNVGIGVCRLMSQRQLVDFAQAWMEKHR